MSMAIQRAAIERINYLNDPRVIARDTPGQFVTLDESSMSGTVIAYGEFDGEEVTVGARYEVCDCCHGRGSHVNPSIDAGGADTSDWDDEDFERYVGGSYDVACYGCKGTRVVPVPVARNAREAAVLAQLEKDAEDDAADRALQRAEMMMGA